MLPFINETSLVILVILTYLAGIASRHPGRHGLEVFAGDMAITTALRTRGFPCSPFEIKLDQIGYDIMSPQGLALCTGYIMQLEPGSMVWSSWLINLNAIPTPRRALLWP